MSENPIVAREVLVLVIHEALGSWRYRGDLLRCQRRERLYKHYVVSVMNNLL